MNQNTITILFIICSGTLFYLINEFVGEYFLSKFIVVFTLGAFFLGKYSAKFPK